MRLREKEITDRDEIDELLKGGNVCHFAMCDGGYPYVLPTTYGYADGHLYIHSSKKGRKIEVLKDNNRVCFTVDTGHELVQGPLDTSCKSTIKFKSVVGTGRAIFVDDPEEKRKAMDVIMEQVFGKADFKYSEEGVKNMIVIRIDIDALTGKKNGY